MARFQAVLSPLERVEEVVFGLIMALTFTGTLSVATADRAEVRTMLIGALGCNLAWGLVDGVMYMLGVLAERGSARPAGDRGMLLHPITGRDVTGAIAVFLLVFLSTFPVALPFLFVHEAHKALRISNGIALALLFGCGWYLGRHAGGRPWLGGILMLVVGVILVALTIALGG
jgi:VIT1/CCC1 family predicted Fe2+/Mn2+ transporter